jgi:hypothetical protein
MTRSAKTRAGAQQQLPKQSTISHPANIETDPIRKLAEYENQDLALVIVRPPAGQIKDADVSPFIKGWLKPTEISTKDLHKGIAAAKAYGKLTGQCHRIAAGFGGLGAMYSFFRGQFFTRVKDLLAPQGKWMAWYTQHFAKDEVSRDMRLYESLKSDGPAPLRGMTAHAAHERFIKPKNPRKPKMQKPQPQHGPDESKFLPNPIQPGDESPRLSGTIPSFGKDFCFADDKTLQYLDKNGGRHTLQALQGQPSIKAQLTRLTHRKQ